MKRLLSCVALCVATMLIIVIPSTTAATGATVQKNDTLAKSVKALNDRRIERDGKTDEFELARIKTDELNKVHTKFRQTVNGIPVWGGEAIIHLNEDGSVFAVTDNFK